MHPLQEQSLHWQSLQSLPQAQPPHGPESQKKKSGLKFSFAKKVNFCLAKIGSKALQIDWRVESIVKLSNIYLSNQKYN